jgi:hypothetical protein
VIAILKATGKPVDEAQVDAVLASIKGRKVDEVRVELFRSLAKDSQKFHLVLPHPDQHPPLLPKRKKRSPRPRRKLPRPKSPSLLLPLKKRTSTWTFSADLNIDYTSIIIALTQYHPHSMQAATSAPSQAATSTIVLAWS